MRFANAEVVINKKGYRGKLVPIEKLDKEIKRIVFLGDSMMFGFGLNEDETLPEQILRIAGNKRVEVINLAVTGHNLNQERLYFERRVLEYDPDIAVFGLCLNDIGGSIFSPSGFNTLIEIGRLKYKYRQFNFLDKVHYALLRLSNFYQYIFYKIEMLYRIEKRVPLYTEVSLKLMKGELVDEMKEALVLFANDVLAIKKACEERGIRLIIMFYITDIQLDDASLRWPQEWLQEFCSENKIYFLDLLPAFNGYSKDKILIDQGHPSSFGNKILAEYLYNFIESNKLIK
jgi:lysophospholipase L1-like esterase